MNDVNETAVSTTVQPVELQFEDIKISCPLEEGHRMVPVRTVCQIIDVDYKSQDSWLKSHDFWSQLYRPSTTVGADGKTRTMNCLSIFDIGFWIGSISSKNRKPGSVEKQYAFLAWLREQTLNLYKSIDLFMQENKYELELIEAKEDLLNKIEEATETVKSYKRGLKQVNESIEEVRAKRFTGQTALPFPEDE
jgi:hypothetical protein